MLRTFKGYLETIVPLDINGKRVANNGMVWNEMPTGPIDSTINIKEYIFTFTENEILFPKDLLEEYKDQLRLDPYFGIKFIDETKYTLNKYYQRSIVHYEIRIEGHPLLLKTNLWNTFKLNLLHNRYWLFNEKKWFVTFLISVVAIIISIVALLKKNHPN